MEELLLEQLSAQAGIGSEYINALGRRQTISPQTKRRLLDAMGCRAGLAAVTTEPLPPVAVWRRDEPAALTPGGEGDYQWRLYTEQGGFLQGEVSAGSPLQLPRVLACGYHRLTLSQGARAWRCRVIIAPPRCYQPEALLGGQRLWGACVQLYTLRSAANWGIGDTGDLKKMVREIARRGGAFVGLNPLHALYPAMPGNASPYSPSSRRWLNTLYIDINSLEDFHLSPAARLWWARADVQRRLAQARAAADVDYPGVGALKLTALRLCWQQFNLREEQDGQRLAFAAFVRLGGASLRHQAEFDALHESLLARDASCVGWPDWPEDCRDIRGAGTQTFRQRHGDEIAFYLWLQWLADGQFAECFALCRALGMPIGLYRDLAVGVGDGGAETWSDPALYCLGASVGAPPDMLGPRGQNWGLAPMDPREMALRGYQPFIDLVRSNMQGCGALRIDHVMSLLRLWWIPLGDTAGQGAYVHYPMEDLLSILALESQRNRCMVIGEDLGTVPHEILARLRGSGVYSYKVLYFEQDAHHNFLAPGAYPPQSMATAATHDLPTLRGYWGAGDLRLGQTLGLYPIESALRYLHKDRRRSRQGLLTALHRHGCLPRRVSPLADTLPMSPVLNRAIHRYLADSASTLLGLQPEDWLDIAAPVNVPGTGNEYPNWRRKLTLSLEEIFDNAGINRLLRDINRRRQLR
ncbi:4-alpha-glucanotransferase [Acerihabitans arboris]|uniref:4-alpha-glucanotransferase n=1 Tax=Acerihabitans arboris TaxID=2691583 RepID=A0A845SMN8_9GAMM|nr:4-alpha-glucanotransferase [Acerihabitans arboris]NDL63828.1 4-alpha-glucanotransferase [Acerihabitans arboris]